MTTMPEEIFSDHIDDNEESPECNKSLSRMNKSELYEFSKKLVKENQKLQLFVNTSDELHKYNQNTKLDMSKKIKELEKDNVKNVERIEFLEKQYIKLKEDNKLKDGIISLHEQGLSRDDVEVEELKEKVKELEKEYCSVCIDYDKLAEDHQELKEKDKKSKELFKLMGEWYEDNIIGHLPESEEEDSDEEVEVDFICKGCQRETTDTITERNCSEYLCRECQKYL